ncbi:Multidrug resistance protein B (plasmid) [Paracoccaceae bacterium]|nr:Multidrug resistance protein B [Paracoccaceae bacterium]
MTEQSDTGADIPDGQGVRLTIVLGVVMCAVLEVLDSTIVNVALPHIRSAFGATSDQVTWVLTSYIVASVVMMPLTGFLSRRIGRRRLILTAICGFAAMSVLGGLSWSLSSLVMFRLGQGLFGAFLIPLAQSILFDAFPREKRGQAMALFGLGVVVAPVLGPTVGAILTDVYSWRLVFFVNLPIAGFALLLLAGELEADHPRKLAIDRMGLALMALGVGALQFVVDQGEQRDWFASHLIQSAAILSVLALAAFLVHGIRKGQDSVVDLSLFADRNFTVANAVMAGFAVCMFGTIAVLPSFVQGLMDYPVIAAGELFIPRGLAAGVSMVVTGSLLQPRVDARLLALVGLMLTAASNFMMGHLTLQADFRALAMPGVLAGLGMGLVFVPLSTLAFDRIGPERQNDASGIYGLTRQLGSSIGIAVVAAQVVRQTAIQYHLLGQHVTPYSQAAAAYLKPLGLSPTDPQGTAVLGQLVNSQASLAGYDHVFTLLGWLALLLVPLLTFARKPKNSGESGAT